MLFRAMPFLGVVMIAYAIFLYGGGLFGAEPFVMETFLRSSLWTITLPSSDAWVMTNGDVFVVVGLFMLGIEGLKSTSTGKTSMVNHMFSMLVFLVGAVLFLLVKGFGTTTFLLIVVMALIDIMVGMLTSIVTARRDFGVATPGVIPTN
jgi:hypothetical protein